MNGAESLVKTLLASGVEVCFANPGTSEMHFVAALDDHPEMRCILCLFEGGTSGAADGYFRMSGRVAATLLHLAPGFGNAFANLHNARKAQSGVVNVMGDHASYHLRHESPLKGETTGISQAISHWTRTSADAAQVAADGAAAVQAARSLNGQIATLILPANTAWEAGSAPQVAAPPPALRLPPAAEIAAAVAALRQPGAALMVDGVALYDDATAQLAARIAAATGARLMAPFFAARSRRGAGSVRMQRLAYELDLNIAILADVKTLVLCGAQRPTAFFAYPGKPSLPEAPGTAVMELADIRMDIPGTLAAMADCIGPLPDLPADARQPLSLPPLPTGALSLEKVGAAIAHLMPEDTVVVNEAITSGAPVAGPLQTARGHEWLVTMGGAIGAGLPTAVGAAVACPERKVLCLSGDGSAMYTLQSLWTMAREGLDICTVIFANDTYRILHGELVNVGATQPGRNVARMFDMVEPSLDWVALAQGHGVQAVRVDSAEAFATAFAEAMGAKGPRLIVVPC
ncbi:acetolactate synthase large subunit [Tabrizicola sp.]|uniref:acetolactate synthase large subunit n=1 Tax=Tabrizicola sp. TaxID=2005166 RepID=UPI003D275876